jgi:SagB-type dehydrogenase family enzyme
MEMDFAKLFHEASKNGSDRKGGPLPIDGAQAGGYGAVSYKEYPRLPLLALPPLKGSRALAALRFLARRRSRDAFSGAPVPIDVLSGILKASCGETGRNVRGFVPRAQPSAGARYPIETYVLVFAPSRGLPAGVYHYAPERHALVCLWQREFSSDDIAALFLEARVRQASAVIVLTGVFARSTARYGPRGYRYVLLEAGHIGQNVHLASGALGIGCRALGGTDDIGLEELLEIDGETESVVYALALGA